MTDSEDSARIVPPVDTPPGQAGGPGAVNPAALTVAQLSRMLAVPEEIPPACTKLTMFIDIHKEVLFYAVCAWEETFTGYIIDYGTLPDQRRLAFTLADATRTLGNAFPRAGTDGAIHAGLEQLVSAYLNRDWSRGGSLMRIDRLLVDMGYKPGIVADVKQKAGGAVMMLAKGVGLRASRKSQRSADAKGAHSRVRPQARRDHRLLLVHPQRPQDRPVPACPGGCELLEAVRA
jgi:hypothetical protein